MPTSLITVFVAFVAVWFICIMFPMKEEYGNKRVVDKNKKNIDWETCHRCGKAFPRKNMEKMKNGEYLCKPCRKVVKVYMDE